MKNESITIICSSGSNPGLPDEARACADKTKPRDGAGFFVSNIESVEAKPSSATCEAQVYAVSLSRNHQGQLGNVSPVGAIEGDEILE